MSAATASAATITKILSRDDMRCEISMAATRPVNRELGVVFDDVMIVL